MGWISEHKDKVFAYLQKLPLFSLNILNTENVYLYVEGKTVSLIYPISHDIYNFFQFDMIDIPDLIDQLAKAVLKYGLAGHRCHWILSQTNYQLHILEELPVAESEFQSAIRWRLKNLLTYAVENAVVDAFPLPQAKTPNAPKNILVVTAQLSYLQPIADAINKSGLSTVDISILELSLRNIAALHETSGAVALVYVQEKQSNLIITSNKTFYLSRRLEWGASTLANYAESEQQERYKDLLALELQRSFDYYQSQWRAPAPQKLIIVDKGMTATDIIAYLAQRLTIQPEALDAKQYIQGLGDAVIYQYLPIFGSILQEKFNHASAN
jgi:MSHA biogenesis protein MshI